MVRGCDASVKGGKVAFAAKGISYGIFKIE